jgi:hypothetical protein
VTIQASADKPFECGQISGGNCVAIEMQILADLLFLTRAHWVKVSSSKSGILDTISKYLGFFAAALQIEALDAAKRDHKHRG